MLLRSHARRLLSAQSDIQTDKNKHTNNEDLSRSARRLRSAKSDIKVDNEKRPNKKDLSRSARLSRSAQSDIKVYSEKRPNKKDLSRSASRLRSAQSDIKVDIENFEKRPNKKDLSRSASCSRSAQPHIEVGSENCINMEDLSHSEATPDCPNNSDTSAGTPVPTKVYTPLVNCSLFETPPPSDGDVTLIKDAISGDTSANLEAEFLRIHTQLIALRDDSITLDEDVCTEWDDILQQIGDYGMLSPAHSEQPEEPHYEPEEPYFEPAFTSTNMGHIESECTCNTPELRKSIQFAFDRLGDVYTAHPWLFDGINMDHWQSSSKHQCDSKCDAHRPPYNSTIVLE